MPYWLGTGKGVTFLRNQYTLSHMALTDLQKKLIGDFIGFDTTSYNSNLPLIEYVIEHLKEAGADITLDYNEDQTKANLLATIGPAEQGAGVLFSGHTDTVPVEGQDWETDPYQLTEKDGRFYGRGTCDMKGFCALALAQFLETAKNKDALTKPMRLLLSYDEEVGCEGAKNFIENMGEDIPAPELVLVGEPTMLHPVHAHKGFYAYQVYVKGYGCHSSAPDNGVNAINLASQLIEELSRLAADLKLNGAQDERFDPPYTTSNVGIIQGGSAANVVADECSFVFEMRPVPGVNPEVLLKPYHEFCRQLEKSYGQVSPECRIEISSTVSTVPFAGNSDHPESQFVVDLTGRKNLQVVAFSTEAGIYQDAGWNTMVCGPGSIDQAHQPNEFIEISQLEAASDMLVRLAQRCFE